MGRSIVGKGIRRRGVLALAAGVGIPGGASRAFASDHAGVGNREITIGQTAALSGPLGSAMRAFNAGAQLAFDQVNAEGGVHQRALRLVSVDDEMKPEKAAQNCATLLARHRAFAFFGAAGNSSFEATIPFLREHEVPLVGNYGLSDAARSKAVGTAYFVRAGFGREAERLIQHMASVGITRIGLAYMNVSEGVEVLQRIQAVSGQLGSKVELVRAEAVRLDGADAASAARRLAASDVQAVVLFLSGAPAVDVVRSIEDAGARPAYYGLSVLHGELLAKALDSQFRGFAISQVVPYPWSEADATASTFRKSIVAATTVTYASYEGHINGLILIEALKRSGPTPTRRSFHAAIRSIRGQVAGLQVDFTSESPTASRFVEIVHVTRQGRFVR